VLVGCAGGSAEEARLGQAKDAGQRSVMAAEQATYTARTFFPPTATPGPQTPRTPFLESLVVTLDFGGDGVPRGSYASVPADVGTVYAGALLNDVQAGQEITAVWTDADGSTIGSARVKVERDAARQWVGLPLRLNRSLPPGDYAVYIFARDHQLNSLVFRVTAPGTGPQPFPDPPTDPQVNTQPTVEAVATEAVDDGGRRRDNQPDQSNSGPVFEVPVIDGETGQIVMVTRVP
jgi:hypothetical protein